MVEQISPVKPEWITKRLKTKLFKLHFAPNLSNNPFVKRLEFSDVCDSILIELQKRKRKLNQIIQNYSPKKYHTEINIQTHKLILYLVQSNNFNVPHLENDVACILGEIKRYLTN